MWFLGSGSRSRSGSSSCRRRRVMYVYLYVVVVLILLLQQMVGATRVFPGNAVAANKVEFNHHRAIIEDNKISKKNHQEEDLFNKYFGGRKTFGPTSKNTTAPQRGFDESKRRVPSCPDPLHN